MKKIIGILLAALLPVVALAQTNHVTGPIVTVETNGTQADGSVNLQTNNAGKINFFTNRTLRGYIDGSTGALTGFSLSSPTLSSPTWTGTLTQNASSGTGLIMSRAGAVASAGIIQGVAALPADVASQTALYSFITNPSNGANATFGEGSADTKAPSVTFHKSRATDGSADTIVASGDQAGDINFTASNGTSFDDVAKIRVTVDATPGASADMPGAIDLQVTPDGSATLASALKITNDRAINLGGSLITFSSGAGTTRTLAVDTTDGTDSGLLCLASADACTTNGTRGAFLTLAGNEQAGLGAYRLGAGNIAGSHNYIEAGSSSSDLSFIYAGNTSNVLWLIDVATGQFRNGGNGGDLALSQTGTTVSIQEGTGASACSGTATANGTTAVTVSTTCARTGSRIFISATSDGTGAAANDQGACWTTNIVNATSFDLDCPDANNNAAYNWFIIHEAP